MVQPVVQPVLGKDAKIDNPATKALAALAILAVLPSFVTIPVNFNIVMTASLCVFVGCWRSVKATPPEDSMSRNVSSCLLIHTALTACSRVCWIYQ